MSDHVMLDIETWGTGSDALIISIGAVKFNPKADDLFPEDWDKFHVGILPHSGLSLGETATADTLMWWMHPDRRDALDEWLGLEKVDLPTALEAFSEWFGKESLPVWGNGATFDNVIMSSAYHLVGLERPWNYKHDRDLRTIKALVSPQDMKGYDKSIEGIIAEKLTYHNALHDATWQAAQLHYIVHELGLEIM